MRLVIDNEMSNDYNQGVADGLRAALTALRSCSDEQFINVGSVREKINDAIEEFKTLEKGG